MPSGLLKSLNNLKKTSGTCNAAATHPIVYTNTFPVKEGLFDISEVALRRMGYAGGAFDIKKALFLDTETTGLSGGAGTVAFLVGIGYIEKNDFVIKQFLCPDYSAEPEMLLMLSEAMQDKSVAIHFNGKRFDMPLLKSRFLMKKMGEKWIDLQELDLLYPSRAVWKLRIGSCKLGNIEERILFTPRGEDIPGSEIPALYFKSVKEHDPEILRDVIHHNMLDIRTLTMLLVKLNGILQEPERITIPQDALSLGKVLEHKGEFGPARKMYHIAAKRTVYTSTKSLLNETYAAQANLKLLRLYRLKGDYSGCEEILNDMIRRRQKDSIPYIEMAKFLEHKKKDPAEALRYTEKALNGFFHTDEEKNEILKRKNRLLEKLQHIKEESENVT